MSTTFQQQAASLPIECVARRLSRATTLAGQPACAQAVAIRRKQYSRLLRNGILASKTPDAQEPLRSNYRHAQSSSPCSLFFTVQAQKPPAGEKAPPTCPLSEVRFYRKDTVQYAALVRCPEFRGCPLFGSRKCIASTGRAVGISTEVRYTEEVCYWEGPLSEVSLYT